VLDRSKLRLGIVATAGLMVVGVSAVAAMPAHATSGITQAGPAEVGNLLDYANSDFEGTIGNWAAVANAKLSDDTRQAFLHDDSLLDTVPTAGTSTFGLGEGSSAVQIPVTGSDTYTVGAYFKIPAVSGQSLTFGLDFYNSAGKSIAWVRTGSLSLAGTGDWQYVSGQIQAPTAASSVIGSPQVTYSGATAGETINMDEASFAPSRAAQIIGAYAGGSATDWTDADSPSDIGPLQSDKIFFIKTTPLSGKWKTTGNTCYEVENGLPDSADWPACVISYNVLESESALADFFTGLPAAQMVIMNWRDEPELESTTLPACGDKTTPGAIYVCDFEKESDNIRQAAGDAPNVFVDMDSATSEYAVGTSHDNGVGCSFIPPSSYVDFYLADHYNRDATDASLPNEAAPWGGEWSTWLSCVAGYHKPIGLAEYGLDCSTANPPQQTLANELGQDDKYLPAIPGATQPTIMWAYWDSDSGKSIPGCQMTSSIVMDKWKSIETQNGGG
jgi:hypothetical protein